MGNEPNSKHRPHDAAVLVRHPYFAWRMDRSAVCRKVGQCAGRVVMQAKNKQVYAPPTHPISAWKEELKSPERPYSYEDMLAAAEATR